MQLWGHRFRTVLRSLLCSMNVCIYTISIKQARNYTIYLAGETTYVAESSAQEHMLSVLGLRVLCTCAYAHNPSASSLSPVPCVN